MKGPLLALAVLLLLGSRAAGSSSAERPVIIGSKKFTESYVLAEIAKGAMARTELRAEHRPGMGGTIILWEALRANTITCYPEYTGTIREVILKSPQPAGEREGEDELDQLRRQLAQYNVGISGALGFNNSYALVMRRGRAEELGIREIGDLTGHPELAVGLSHEFLGRADGWGPLSQYYGLEMRSIRGMDHTLAYVALAKAEIDVTDAYTTDPKIEEEDLTPLRDEKAFFPEYKAVFLYRLDADPRVSRALQSLAGTLSAKRMIQLNATAEKTRNYAEAAAVYFHGQMPGPAGSSLAANLARWTGRHLVLVGVSLLASILIGVPLGIWASCPGWTSEVILGFTGLVQTVPSLALLAMLVSIPFLGISPATAIVALFLYGLLPIVRNTASGIQDIPRPIRESAEVLGLEPWARLTKIFLPLASRSILAGIKTSAVINVGTATLAALIGAGGLGEPIISGLNLNDSATILEGAIPAAILAILVQVGFGFLDRLVIPRGLRRSSP